MQEAIEDGKLTPYKTDLEYLVDAVELVSRKGCLYQVPLTTPHPLGVGLQQNKG